MNIGIDLDEVLGGLVQALTEYHNAAYGTTLSRESFKVYSLSKTLGGTREQEIQKLHDFYQTPYFLKIQPVLGSQAGVMGLRGQGHRLWVITARPEILAAPTNEWLEFHFPGAFSGIHFANHFAKEGPEKTKIEFCDALKIETLIDDSLEFATECARPHRTVFLLNAPWNQSPHLPPHIHRVRSWDEIVETVAKSKQ